MIYDWDKEPFAWEGDFDPAWDWPRIPEGPMPGALLDPCEFGCDLGTVFWGSGLKMTCPVCNGKGTGKEHKC